MGIAVIPAPAAAAGKTQKFQEFTSTGTWTAPTGVVAVECFLVGAGGGGGGTYGNNASGGGGGGGEALQRMITVVPGTTYTITIGAGGTAGTANSGGGTRGGDGNNSTFGALLTAVGGGGGASTATNGPNETGVGSTTASSGGGSGPSTSVVGGSGGGAMGPAFGGFPIKFGGASATTNGSRSRLVGSSGNKGCAAITDGASGTFSQRQPGPGLNGYGEGGTGAYNSTQLPYQMPEQGKYSGVGRDVSANNAGAGGAATANYGGGGGGAGSQGATSYNGGAGGSGYCSIVWWE
jgi:hypothetical protein